MPESDFFDILAALRRSEVDFILVGGLAAAVVGVVSSTLDVDIVHSRDAANVARLLPVLESLDAVFRIQPERRIKPNSSYVSGPGHLNLITRFGPLDVLGAIGRGLTYIDLLPHSVEKDIGDGILVPVLDLETRISLREALGPEKDRGRARGFRRRCPFRRS